MIEKTMSKPVKPTHKATLERMLRGSPYQSYAYSYPHKMAYRPLDPPRELSEVWEHEDKSALFLYMHIPFCEMRCGFCNLFTMAKPKQPLAETYMTALRRQARQVKQAIGDASFARLAIGGGTPTQLELDAFIEVFDIIEQEMGADLTDIPVSCEMSPETVDEDKVRVMIERGVKRASIGVQSFLEEETRAVRRPQKREDVLRSLTIIREAGFEVFNLDLIYGMPFQTEASWTESLEDAMRFSPEEVYLYPLYVRPLTGLGNSSKSWDDHRLDLYRQGRTFLLERGYEQASMRMFRKKNVSTTPGPIYHCQEDGMVGLGAGARSYSSRLHYSTDYAVGRRGVVSIIEDFVAREDAAFARADYGFTLDEAEDRRRWVILSTLSGEGLDAERYRERFGGDVFQEFPQLEILESLELATKTVTDDDEGNAITNLRLTQAGMERSDVIGPWFNSEPVNDLIATFDLV